MALSIKDPEADRLARRVAKEAGETITQAVVTSLRERWDRQRRRKDRSSRRERIRALRDSMKNLPVVDDRPADEILGYDHNGLPR